MLYQQAQASAGPSAQAGPGPAGGAEAGGQTAGPEQPAGGEDEVIDAEYEVKE
jgi:hypothetical protein